MRRFFVILLVVAVVFLSCGRSGHPKLTFYIGGAPDEVGYWEALVDSFESSSKIAVEVIRQPTDSDQRRQGLIIPLKSGKSEPDVFLMDVAWVGQFALSDWLTPLNTHIDDDNFATDKFFSAILEQVDIYQDGKMFALPANVDCGLLYYRKDLLAKYDFEVPVTWRQLAEYSATVQAEQRKANEDFYGYVWQGAPYEGLVCNFLEFSHAAGGAIIEDGEVVVDSDENLKALTFMKALVHELEISPPNVYTEMKEEESRRYFQAGDALFERNWPYARKLHQSKGSAVRDKFGIALLPKFKGGRHATTLGGWHIGISKFSDCKDDAWELVKFILSYETQKKLVLNLGLISGRKDLYEDEKLLEAFPNAPVLQEALEHTVARPNLPIYTQISQILQRELSAVFSGERVPEEALKRAEEQIEQTRDIYHD